MARQGTYSQTSLIVAAVWMDGLKPLTCTVDISASSRNIWISVCIDDINSGTLYKWPVDLSKYEGRCEKNYSGLSSARVPKLTAVFRVLARESNAKIRRYFTDVCLTFPGTNAPTNPGAAKRKTIESIKPRKDCTVMRVNVSDNLCSSSSEVSWVVSPLPMVDLASLICK